MRTFLSGLDRTVTTWILTVFPASLKPFFMTVTTFGDPFFTIGIGITIMAYGLVHNIRLFWAGLTVPAVLFVGALLKLGFERMRPVSDYVAKMQFDTYSFPSGHSSGSMIAYGLLAYIAFIKLPAPFGHIMAGLLLLVPLFVGISRVYLGAHYPSDVIGGWLLGLVGLTIIIFLIRPFV